jgi:hypothetical protein
MQHGTKRGRSPSPSAETSQAAKAKKPRKLAPTAGNLGRISPFNLGAEASGGAGRETALFTPPKSLVLKPGSISPGGAATAGGADAGADAGAGGDLLMSEAADAATAGGAGADPDGGLSMPAQITRSLTTFNFQSLGQSLSELTAVPGQQPSMPGGRSTPEEEEQLYLSSDGADEEVYGLGTPQAGSPAPGSLRSPTPHPGQDASQLPLIQLAIFSPG